MVEHISVLLMLRQLTIPYRPGLMVIRLLQAWFGMGLPENGCQRLRR